MTRYESASDLAQYRKKVEYFLKEHQDHVAIQKLKFNKLITPTNIAELERILFESGELANKETFSKVFGEQESLGLFIRKMVGLDRKATEELFADYLQNTLFSANQIAFITKVIDYLMQNGEMDAGLLYEPPFTDFHSECVEGIFTDDKVDEIIYLIKNINKNAAIQADIKFKNQ